MDKQQIRIDHSHLDWDELPPDVRRACGDCPETRAWFEQNTWTRRAVALRRHETDPAAEGRIQHRTMTRLANMGSAELRREQAGWLGRHWPALAFGAAGLAVGLFAFQAIFPGPVAPDAPPDIAGTETHDPRPNGIQAPLPTGPIEFGLPVERSLTNSILRPTEGIRPAGQKAP